MNININQLLEKYWNAEASLQEEAELRAYFSSDDVAPDHVQYKDLFTFYSVSRLQSTDLDVETVLSNLSNIDVMLDNYWIAEASLEEEAQLREYFSSDSIAPEHEQYKDLFTFYEVGRSQSTDLEIENVINSNKHIDLVLDKYWNAEASLEEENILKEYFASDKVEEKHQAYIGMFEIYSAKSLEHTDLDFKEILTKAADESGERAIGSPEMPGAAKTKVFQLRKWAAGLAAVFVLGFAAVSLMNQNEKTQYKGHATILDEEAEAQEAYEITKEALAFLSKNMNKGSKTVKESVAKVEKVSIFK